MMVEPVDLTVLLVVSQ